MADIVSGDSLREFSHKDSCTKVRAQRRGLDSCQRCRGSAERRPGYTRRSLAQAETLRRDRARTGLYQGSFTAFLMRDRVDVSEVPRRISRTGEHERARAMCKLGYGVDLVIACFTLLVLVLTAHWARVLLTIAQYLVLWS
jgi:hypothetical protein